MIILYFKYYIYIYIDIVLKYLIVVQWKYFFKRIIELFLKKVNKSIQNYIPEIHLKSQH